MADQKQSGEGKSTPESDAKDKQQLTQQSQPDNRPPSQEERYTATAWKERARQRFDASPHEIAGALHDTGDSELTEQQVQARLNDYRDREHEVDA